MRFHERQRLAREQEIVSVARQLLASKGYHDTSMEEVAETVGISKATLYQHFPSKDDLVGRLIVEHLDRLLALLDSPADGAAPVERLAAALRLMVTVHTRGIGPELDTNAGAIRALVLDRPACRERYERVVARLVALVVEGQAAGALHPGLAAPVVVQAMFALSCAAGAMCGQRGDALDPATAGESVVRLFLDGVRRTSPPHSPSPPAERGSGGEVNLATALTKTARPI